MTDRPKLKVNLENVTFLERAQDFIDTYSFPVDLVLDVVRNPDVREKDPYTEEAGYLVIRCRRGDITVALGLRDPENPSVLYIYLHTPEEHTHSDGTHKAGGARGSKIPTSESALKGWLHSEGCRLAWNGRGHMNVYWNDVLLGGIASTGSSRNVKNDFMFMRRRLTAERVKREFSERTAS